MALRPNEATQPITESASNPVWRAIHAFANRSDSNPMESVLEPYTAMVESSSWGDRARVYQAVLEEVQDHRLPTDALLPFICFEPHHRLITNVVRSYLELNPSTQQNAFAPIAHLMTAVQQGATTNPGAVLASVVLLGDRRFNAYARATRQFLQAKHVRSFSRTHTTCICAGAVEFSLDWLVHLQELNNDECQWYVASALMLMVLHDETGIVRDQNMAAGEDSRFLGEQLSTPQNFEDYFQEVLPTMVHLRDASKDRRLLDEVISLWKEHAEEAAGLRENH